MDPSSRIGTTLRGKWRIDRLLGSGGFASVYAATHRAGKRVAIKVLHPALSASSEVRRRFLKEAYAANAIDHPGVVGVSDDDVAEDGAAFLVMDLLDGDTVDARRKKSGGKLALSEVLSVAEQALDALAAAHEKGIVHRDLKPENLFWTTAGQLRVLDFGIARFREPGDESSSTQTGLTMGSPAFMAPEQARGRWSEVDARTDVYAMGATMFTLLTGKLVHGTTNLNEALIAAATTPAPRLSGVAPDVPQVVAAVVDRALAFDKNERWENARTMQMAVASARAGITAGGTGTMPLAPAPLVTGEGSVAAMSVLHQTTPLGTGPAAPAMKAPTTTEIAAANALPDFVPPAGGPITTPAGVVTTSAPRRKIGAGVLLGGGLAVLAVAGAIALWVSGRSSAAAQSGTAIVIPEVTGNQAPEKPVVTAASAAPSASDTGMNGAPATSGGGSGAAAASVSPTASVTGTPPATASQGTAGGSGGKNTVTPGKTPAKGPPPSGAKIAPPPATTPPSKMDPLLDRPRNK